MAPTGDCGSPLYDASPVGVEAVRGDEELDHRQQLCLQPGVDVAVASPDAAVVVKAHHFGTVGLHGGGVRQCDRVTE